MSFHASTNAQRTEHGIWRALTRLDGFEFPPEPLLTGEDLKSFRKVMMGKSSWRHLSQGDLVIRVTAIFEAAYSIYENEDEPPPNGSFYVSVAKKASKSKLKDYNVFRQIMETYVDGLKRVAARSESHIYVDRRSAPAALSVASWIELTEGAAISITTKKPTDIPNDSPPEQKPRKRRAEAVDNERANEEAKARKAQLKKAIADRDQVSKELQDAKLQIHDLTQKLEATQYKYSTQAVRLANAEQEVKKKTTELKHAEAKRVRLLKGVRAVQRERRDMIASIKRQYDDHASQYFTRVETEWRNATRELALAKLERDRSQGTLADCAKVVKSLNCKLNGENGSA
ncbi:hypothetical protein F4825DRAFT_469473 [Nemania diffusa]|nr:hypothetical protein F4825DRAFT_469473 [Nemania diffusa]